MILVVDDEQSITEMLTDVLEFHGYPVMVAHDARQALDLVQLTRPEIILVDLMMPSVDGLSLAVTLRHHPATRGVPLIAMSASGSALALADRMGDFNAHVSKPFETDRLISLIEQYIGVPS